jgi:CDP-glucose 4,6-dehydratase
MEWAGRRVLVTGHTGFKGAWLSLWLRSLGAHVTGLALAPQPGSIFQAARVAHDVDDRRVDLRDPGRVLNTVREARPDVVFHLAAQALVQEGYREPASTYETNVMGTLNVLEAARRTSGINAIVCVTTDKVYRNAGSGRPFTEDDPLAGQDPYSNSKACADLLTQSHALSFWSDDAQLGTLATARAGNVFGGGDHAPDRLVPSTLAAWRASRPVRLRSPDGIRPWQHVFDPLAGYLKLAEGMLQGEDGWGGAWNFGPGASDVRTVRDVVELMEQLHPRPTGVEFEPGGFHEAKVLLLDSTKAHKNLGWLPRWDLERGLRATLAWDLADQANDDLRELALQQLAAYRQEASRAC